MDKIEKAPSETLDTTILHKRFTYCRNLCSPHVEVKIENIDEIRIRENSSSRVQQTMRYKVTLSAVKLRV